MRQSLIRQGLLVVAIAIAGCSSNSALRALTPSDPSQSPTQSTSGHTLTPFSISAFPASISAFPVSISAFPVSIQAFPVCVAAAATGGKGPAASAPVACGAQVRNPLVAIPVSVNPMQLPGYQPVHLQAMYGLTDVAKTAGVGQTVAVVSAFIDTTIESDLAVYRTTFGLPACTVANGCLTIVKPNGNRPIPDHSWGIETALDTEMVSAICPLCKIVVVEAKSAQIQDLAEAQDQAAAQHPVAISNSYAVSEIDSDNGKPNNDLDKYSPHYRRSDVAVIAGAGDAGYNAVANYPASIPEVVAVGGTSVRQNLDGTFAAPTVWSGTSSGCSVIFKKPKWQTDTGCKNRTVADTAALADPQTGVMGYTSYNGGWNVYGGTSIAAPQIAAMYALAAATHGMKDPSELYEGAPGLYPISGSNGTCSPPYLCNAGAGYNGPAGVGVPYGISAFTITH